MTDTASSWHDWIGADVVGDDGKKLGTLDAIYMDRASGQPEWLVVATGLFGAKRTFVPLAGATADGDALRVPYSKSLMKDAPGISDDDVLSSEEEARLYAHYGRDDYEPYESEREGAGFGGSGDTRSPTTDDAMTRSEEELQVGTRSVETGRVRLRKYVATEHVTTTVPVRKEKVRVEREPITDANQDRATKGPDIAEEEREITLHEERPVVSKETVAKERVRLHTDVETDQREVSEDIRKEQIEVEDDTARR